MAFQYTDENRESYFREGYTVLRSLIPVALLEDLRRETDQARLLARRQHGAQAQRLQPVYAYKELNPQPFRDFLALPGLQETARNILGDAHQPTDIMGVLLEPAESAWCTNWHRDWYHHVPVLDWTTYYEQAMRNPLTLNQLNAALYDDASLWVVPRSHDRPDTGEERALSPQNSSAPDLRGLSEAERERACLTYARRMPHAQQVVLGAGDVAFYRSCLWHLGNYVPYTRRATLHDGFYGPDDWTWRERMRLIQERARASAQETSG